MSLQYPSLVQCVQVLEVLGANKRCGAMLCALARPAFLAVQRQALHDCVQNAIERQERTQKTAIKVRLLLFSFAHRPMSATGFVPGTKRGALRESGCCFHRW